MARCRRMNVLVGVGAVIEGFTEKLLVMEPVAQLIFQRIHSFEPVRELIIRILLSQAPDNQERKDYKTTLQEVVQRHSGQVLTYHMVSQSGPEPGKSLGA